MKKIFGLAVAAVALTACTPTSTTVRHAARVSPPSFVVFKVSGQGKGLDITYGSNADSRQGPTHAFSASLPFNPKSAWYTISAQLMGSGDITCSIFLQGKLYTAHASGGYNICNVQVNQNGDGTWEQ